MNTERNLVLDRANIEAAVAPKPGEPHELSAAERRAHQRIPVLFEVDYRADDTFLFAYITDISVMGIFIHTPQPEPPGTHLALRFSPPHATDSPPGSSHNSSGDAEPIECEGEVIWINPPRDGQSRDPGMGIRFVGLSLEQSERILGLVRTFAWLDDTRSDDLQ